MKIFFLILCGFLSSTKIQAQVESPFSLQPEIMYSVTTRENIPEPVMNMIMTSLTLLHSTPLYGVNLQQNPRLDILGSRMMVEIIHSGLAQYTLPGVRTILSFNEKSDIHIEPKQEGELIVIRLFWDKLAYKTEDGKPSIVLEAAVDALINLAYEVYGNAYHLLRRSQAHSSSLLRPSHILQTNQEQLKISSLTAAILFIEQHLQQHKQRMPKFVFDAYQARKEDLEIKLKAAIARQSTTSSQAPLQFKTRCARYF